MGEVERSPGPWLPGQVHPGTTASVPHGYLGLSLPASPADSLPWGPLCPHTAGRELPRDLENSWSWAAAWERQSQACHPFRMTIIAVRIIIPPNTVRRLLSAERSSRRYSKSCSSTLASARFVLASPPEGQGHGPSANGKPGAEVNSHEVRSQEAESAGRQQQRPAPRRLHVSPGSLGPSLEADGAGKPPEALDSGAGTWQGCWGLSLRFAYLESLQPSSDRP